MSICRRHREAGKNPDEGSDCAYCAADDVRDAMAAERARLLDAVRALVPHVSHAGYPEWLQRADVLALLEDGPPPASEEGTHDV